jgi:hypothetical protein
LQARNAVFFPVRSNAGWFKSIETVKQLEARLKIAVFCFDKVVLENDRYELSITENGAVELPGLALLGAPRDFRFDEGGEVSLSFSPIDEQGNTTNFIPFVSGKALVSYHADFVPILEPNGVLRDSCFGWVHNPLADDVVEQSKIAAEKELENREFLASLPFNSFEKSYVVRNYYHDLARVEKLRMPMFLDNRVSELFSLKDRQLLDLAPDVMPYIYSAALLRNMPDVSSLPWEDLIQIRETPVVQAFRDMVARIRANVLYELPNLKSKNDVSFLVSQYLISEILEEVAQFMPTKPGIAMGMVLNLVPAFGGALSGAMGVSDYIKSRQSWITLFTGGADRTV